MYALRKKLTKEEKKQLKTNSDFLFEYFKLLRFKIFKDDVFSTYFMIFKGILYNFYLYIFFFITFYMYFFSATNKHKFRIHSPWVRFTLKLNFTVD